MPIVSADVPESVHLKILAFARKYRCMKKVQSFKDEQSVTIEVPNVSAAVKSLIDLALEGVSL